MKTNIFRDRRLALIHKTSVYSFATHSKSQNMLQNTVKKLFLPLTIYMWAHGIGYTMRCRYKRKNLILNILSIICFIIYDGGIFCYLHLLIVSAYKSKSIQKQHITKCITLLLNLSLRCILRCRWQKICLLLHEIGNIYDKVNCNRKSKLHLKFFSVLIMYDIYQMVKLFAYISALKSPYFLGYLGDFFYHGAIPPPYSTPVHYINILLLQLCNNSIPFVAFFSCICILIAKVLQEIGGKIHDGDRKCAFDLFSQTMNFSHKLNKNLHSLLLISITDILLFAFIHAYTILFIARDNSSLVIHRILNIIISFSSFAFLCIVASTVKDTSEDIRRKLKVVSAEFNVSKSLQFFLKLPGKFTGFALFNAIILQKSLIMTAVGTFLTYGVLIATFNLNDKGKN